MPPTEARLTGRRKTPVPIMLPATSIVACRSDILRAGSLTGASGRAPRPLLQALDVVDACTVLDPVGVVTEAGEPAVPGRERAQVAEVGAVDRAGRLARHEHGDAR